MSSVTIIYNGGSERSTIENPEFVQTLCNINKVAVDGTIYHEVSEVTFGGDDK